MINVPNIPVMKPELKLLISPNASPNGRVGAVRRFTKQNYDIPNRRFDNYLFQ